jgi:alpha-glucosidase (family GH31 glycosyl hydrolase)
MSSTMAVAPAGCGHSGFAPPNRMSGSRSGSSSGASASGSSAGRGGSGAGGGTCAAPGVPVAAAQRVSNGNPILPPKWAFGVLWGSYYDQNGTFVDSNGNRGNIGDAAATLRADGYGGDLLWIDSSWLYHVYSAGTATAPYYIDFAFDPAAFPDPRAMIATLRQAHFHFGVWQWPWMDHRVSYFATGVTDKYFVMNGGRPATVGGSGWHGDRNPAAFDFTNPATVIWWMKLNESLTDWGVDFLKLDTSSAQLNDAVTSGGGTLADPTKDYTHERNSVAYAATKLYAAANHPDAGMNGARGFIMPKAPAPGNDQFPGWWTDDWSATFAGMQDEMSAASKLNTATTAAYWCGDTGGYNGTPTDELYIRWLEYSTFTPLQEFFGSKTNSVGAKFPWLFGKKITQLPTITKKYNQLRYRLLPFRYSNAQAAYHVTPVKYPVTWRGSALLLSGDGDSQVLVQPVTNAGQTMSTVTLPTGAWIPVQVGVDAGFTATGAAAVGTVSVPSPIDQEPMFVRAGSIVPMGPVVQWVDELPADPLTLDVYPAGSTSYTLYEDDGISEGYLGGAYATTTFTSNDTSGHVVVTIGSQATAKYPFTGQLCSRTYVLKIDGQGTAPAIVTRDGNAEPTSSAAAFAGATEGWYYDRATKTVWVKFPLSSKAMTSVSL